jgi:hypothetical protein
VDVAGDANGDGFSDLLEARTLSVGANHVRLHFGDGGRGVNRPFVMRTSDQARRIALLGRSNDDDGFGLRAWTRTPKGRGRLRVQWEVESVGAPFDGVGLQQTAFAMSPAPVNGVGSLQSFDGFASGVSPGARQHVRVRTQTRSPFFPRSPWFSPQGNGATEADLSTSGTPVSVGDPDGLPAMLALAPPYPNPASRAVTFAFTLPRAGEVELAIFDLAGRRVASVVAGLRAGGTQRARWDGRDAAGGEAKQGVYFAKLTSAGRSVARKVIVLDE